MNRRSFLRNLGLTIAITLSVLVGFGYARAAGYLGRLIRKRLPYLQPSDEVIEKFSNDFLQYSPARLRATLENVSIFAGLFTLLEACGLRTQKASLDEHALRVFLLSTDFFRTRSPAVQYTGFYDPHLFGCQNPFAELE